MYTVSHPVYNECVELKLGHQRLNPIYQDIIDHINQSFEASVINFYFEKKAGYLQQLIYLISTSIHEADKLESAMKRNEKLSGLFEDVLKTDPSTVQDPFRNAYYQIRKTSKPELLFPSCSLEYVVLEEAIKKARVPEVLMQAFPEWIWALHVVSSITGVGPGSQFNIFFPTLEKWKAAAEKGFDITLRKEILQVLKKYDPLDVLTLDCVRPVFDSKESIDEQNGNEYYYYK